MTNTLIIGGGIGGFTVASELRTRGYDGAITIIDPEGYPYDRPPLSKEVLTGAKNAEQLLLSPRGWYEDNAITIVRDRVTGIDAQAQTVSLAGGQELPYERVVITQ